MGLKCSLLGHSFDERDVVRERESTGSQVVTVAKDVERCSRCGSSRVVSTNKEVVSAANATADGGVDAQPAVGTPGTSQDGAPGGPEAPGDAGPAREQNGAADSFAADATGGEARAPANGERIDGAPQDGTPERAPGGFDSTGETAATGPEPAADASDVTLDLGADTAPANESGPAPGPEDGLDDDADPATEDAEILGGEADTGDRAPGRWPGEETEDAWEPTPLTAADEPADGDDESPAEAEASTEASPETDGDTEPTDEPAEAVDQPADADDDAEIMGASAGGESGGTPDTVAEPAPEVDQSPEPMATATFTVESGQYRCPACGHRIDADSSFRVGDACPECVTGYLTADD